MHGVEGSRTQAMRCESMGVKFKSSHEEPQGLEGGGVIAPGHRWGCRLSSTEGLQGQITGESSSGGYTKCLPCGSAVSVHLGSVCFAAKFSLDSKHPDSSAALPTCTAPPWIQARDSLG